MLQALKRGSLAVLSFWTVLLLTLSFTTVAQEKENSVDQTEMTQLAGADFWRQVRAGEAGYTTSTFPEHGVLISTPGQTWYLLKEKWMSPAGAIAIFGSIAMVIMAYVFVGPLMLSKPRTGKKIKRWSRWDRALHWSMAFTFL
ncbi:formate dehydrogenase subunit gamma, partial [Vibrio vulnificus]